MNDAVHALLRHQPRLMPGEVWLAGAGPGDPGHLTLFALAGLDQAECVVHDALVDPRVLALARPGAAMLPVGKRGGQPSWRQDEITARLIALAQAGKRVLRLKGGDPCVFGRGGEEALALAGHGIRFRFVPGITAGLGGLLAAGMPATLRGTNQAIVLATGHDADGDTQLDWPALVRLGQPMVFYMGFRQMPRIARSLLDAGLDGQTPAAAIAAATLPTQHVVSAPLAALTGAVAAAGLAAPALLVVGGIVGLRARFEALLAGCVADLRWPSEP